METDATTLIEFLKGSGSTLSVLGVIFILLYWKGVLTFQRPNGNGKTEIKPAMTLECPASPFFADMKEYFKDSNNKQAVMLERMAVMSALLENLVQLHTTSSRGDTDKYKRVSRQEIGE